MLSWSRHVKDFGGQITKKNIPPSLAGYCCYPIYTFHYYG